MHKVYVERIEHLFSATFSNFPSILLRFKSQCKNIKITFWIRRLWPMLILAHTCTINVPHFNQQCNTGNVSNIWLSGFSVIVIFLGLHDDPVPGWLPGRPDRWGRGAADRRLFLVHDYVLDPTAGLPLHRQISHTSYTCHVQGASGSLPRSVTV